MSKSFDVVIIGCGPVGAALGNLLGKLGISTCILERDTSPYALPRAGHFDDEVMRLWQTIGLAEQVHSETHVNPGMTFVGGKGDTLLRWPRPMGVGPQAWHASYRFHQPYLEATLRHGLTRFAGQQLLLGCHVQSIEQSADRVDVTCNIDGAPRVVTGKYLVGCDGGKSIVRATIDTTMEDLGSHERWLVVDVVLKRPRDDLGDFTIQYCDPDRPVTYARCVGDRRRWEIMVLPGDDAERIAEPASVWKLLARWVTPDDADIERATVYTFHGLIARDWRRGRLMVAGDAAHLMPPFLGQGMCSGVRDVSNLAWKLAAVVHGTANEALLDTYQRERSPHVREYVELAIRLGNMIQTRDPDRARERDEMLARDPQVIKSIKPRLGPSDLNHGEGPAGMLSEQVRLTDGSLLDDAVGNRFAVLMRSSFASNLPRELLDGLDDQAVAILAGEGEDYLARLGVNGLVVRPDRYVLAGVRTCAELAVALDQIAGLIRRVEPA